MSNVDNLNVERYQWLYTLHTSEGTGKGGNLRTFFRIDEEVLDDLVCSSERLTGCDEHEWVDGIGWCLSDNDQDDNNAS